MLLVCEGGAEGEAKEEVFGDVGGVAEQFAVCDPVGRGSIREEAKEEVLNGMGKRPGLLRGLERQIEDQEKNDKQREDFECVFHLGHALHGKSLAEALPGLVFLAEGQGGAVYGIAVCFGGTRIAAA